MDLNDRYGVTSAVKLYYGALFSSAGCRYIDTDKDGELYFTLLEDTRCVDVLNKIFDLTTDNVYISPASDIHSTDFDFFMNRHSLFLATSIAYSTRFREFEDDIAFLPIPKYDETQEEYRSLSAGGAVAVLPATILEERLENVGLLLEALSYESYDSVLPAYYETTLKGKYARDEDSEKMLEIILGSSFYDLGVSIWPSVTQNVIMEKVFLNMNNTISSTIAGMESSVTSKISELTEKTSEK